MSWAGWSCRRNVCTDTIPLGLWNTTVVLLLLEFWSWYQATLMKKSSAGVVTLGQPEHGWSAMDPVLRCRYASLMIAVRWHPNCNNPRITPLCTSGSLGIVSFNCRPSSVNFELAFVMHLYIGYLWVQMLAPLHGLVTAHAKIMVLVDCGCVCVHRRASVLLSWNQHCPRDSDKIEWLHLLNIFKNWNFRFFCCWVHIITIVTRNEWFIYIPSFITKTLHHNREPCFTNKCKWRRTVCLTNWLGSVLNVQAFKLQQDKSCFLLRLPVCIMNAPLFRLRFYSG